MDMFSRYLRYSHILCQIPLILHPVIPYTACTIDPVFKVWIIENSKLPVLGQPYIKFNHVDSCLKSCFHWWYGVLQIGMLGLIYTSGRIGPARYTLHGKGLGQPPLGKKKRFSIILFNKQWAIVQVYQGKQKSHEPYYSSVYWVFRHIGFSSNNKSSFALKLSLPINLIVADYGLLFHSTWFILLQPTHNAGWQ